MILWRFIFAGFFYLLFSVLIVRLVCTRGGVRLLCAMNILFILTPDALTRPLLEASVLSGMECVKVAAAASTLSHLL